MSASRPPTMEKLMPCAAAAPHTFLRVTGDRRPGRPPGPWAHDDDQLLILLVTTWALATGRTPPGRPADRLTPEELIEFWADEQTASGSPPSPGRRRPTC
ncbi:hypothetical protein HTZ77_13280 [Nonomuraea sp. SMC257]|uniref:Uncharacterized protein n=1 Tax=Nonomuraea montanisoli TaxID=2741721 RepID=A0A7Y6I7V6_9ACTN|nr:hypothetical protein [Nonomuraea montanisoli]NUW32395.1 hypothetical protein [Nonomuraea montanisoli]